MFNSFLDTKFAADFAAKSLAPFARLTDIAAATFEKAARFQVETAIAATNHAAARLQATVQASGNPYQFAARHAELTAEFVTASNQKWQEYLKLTTDLQSDVTKWAEDAKSQVATQFAPLMRAA